MGTVVISISLDGAGPGITLDDGQSNGPNITTNVKNGDTVKWKLNGNNTGITSLDGIDDTSTDVFNPDPTKNSDGSWQGTISASPGSEETYLVEYTFNGIHYNHDPKIQVNP
jgi:hypothetical protein